MRTVLAAALLLSACAAPPAPGLAAPGSPTPGSPTLGSTVSGPPLVGVVCRPDGLVAVLDTGERVAYAGADPSDPAICLSRGANGRVNRSVAGFADDGTEATAARRAGLASLFPLAVGRTGTNEYRAIPTGASIPTLYRETWRVTGEEDVRVGATTRPAWVVEQRRLDVVQNAAFTRIHHMDKATGARLAFSHATESRNNPLRPWRVVALRGAP